MMMMTTSGEPAVPIQSAPYSHSATVTANDTKVCNTAKILI